MKKSILLAGMFVAVLGITTGVLAAQYGGAQADKPKAAAKPHTMTGCLEKGATANTFTLTNVEGTGPKTVELHATASKKLSAHLGHKVAITGPEIDPTTLKKGTAGKTETDAPAKPSGAEHHMRVNSVKMISETCS